MALPLLGAAALAPAALQAATPAVVERSQRTLMGTQVDMVARVLTLALCAVPWTVHGARWSALPR
jgi:hypothetical protein